MVSATERVRPGRAAVVTACLLLAACNLAVPTPRPQTVSVTPSGSATEPATDGAAVSSLPSASAAGSSAGSSPSSAASPDSAAATPATSPRPGAGASIDAGPVGLRVVESGFTAFSSDGNDFASFAAVVHNPNDQWAVFQMQMTIDFFDGDDNFIAGEELFVQVLPGQRTAIAGEAFGAGQATRMTVNLPEDMSAFKTSRLSSGLFRIAGLETSRSDGLNITRGRLTSQATTTESLVQLTAVYRNGRGAIIGGAVGGVDAIGPGSTISFEVIDGAPYTAISDTEAYWQVSGVRR
jgi:hypothetical protein